MADTRTFIDPTHKDIGLLIAEDFLINLNEETDSASFKSFKLNEALIDACAEAGIKDIYLPINSYAKTPISQTRDSAIDALTKRGFTLHVLSSSNDRKHEIISADIPIPANETFLKDKYHQLKSQYTHKISAALTNISTKQIDNLYDGKMHFKNTKMTIQNELLDAIIIKVKNVHSAYHSIEGTRLSKHGNDISKLISVISTIKANKQEENQLLQSIQAIEAAYEKVLNRDIKPFLNIGNWKSSMAFVNKLNSKPEHHHYARMLGLLLTDIYQCTDANGIKIHKNHTHVANINIPNQTKQTIQAAYATLGFTMHSKPARQESTPTKKM